MASGTPVKRRVLATIPEECDVPPSYKPIAYGGALVFRRCLFLLVQAAMLIAISFAQFEKIVESDESAVRQPEKTNSPASTSFISEGGVDIRGTASRLRSYPVLPNATISQSLDTVASQARTEEIKLSPPKVPTSHPIPSTSPPPSKPQTSVSNGSGIRVSEDLEGSEDQSVDASTSLDQVMEPGTSLKEINRDLVVEGVGYSLDDVDTEHSPLFPLPRPVVVVGLPKAGSSSIHRFFDSAGYRSANWDIIPTDWDKTTKPDMNNLVGVCMRKAKNESKPLLKTCGNFDVWAQMDVMEDADHCVFPQISYLDEIHQESPNATFILNRRELEQWASSVIRWKGGLEKENRKPMAKRLASCHDVGPRSDSKSDLIDWQLDHIKRVRQFVKDHPSHALLEIDIADPNTAARMGRAFQLPSENWGRQKDNKDQGSLAETKINKKDATEKAARRRRKRVRQKKKAEGEAAQKAPSAKRTDEKKAQER